MMRVAITPLAGLLLIASTSARADDRDYFSPAALAADADGQFIYVAGATGSRIVVVDVATGRVVREIELPDPPKDLLVDGNKLLVTAATAEGKAHVIDAGSGSITRTIPTGHMPSSPVLSRDGETLYVLNRFENAIRVLDWPGGELVTRIEVGREPIDAALTADGRTLVVAHHLPDGAATDPVVAAKVSFIDTEQMTVVGSVQLPNGSTSVREICLSPDGRFAFCTHILGRFHNPTTQLIRGWINTNAFSIIDVRNQQLYATLLLDDVDLGAANPWGIACSTDGSKLAITHAGTHEVSLIDLPGLLAKLADLDDAQRIELAYQFSFLTGLRQRIALKGNGPRAATFIGSSLCATEYFSDSLGVVEPEEGESADVTVQSIALSSVDPFNPRDPVRIGEIYFHDASRCFQQWQSCTSCHPDSRADALNWDLLNDGFGNPKNTKSMLLAHETPPAMITGIRASAEVAVRAGVRFIEFSQRPDEELEAIDAYLKSLEPLPSPHLVDGELSPAAQRGRAVFEKAMCHMCHKGPYFTDQKQYDLAMTTGQDKGRPLDTPTLIEVWRTAPYLFDGRARDLRSVLTEHNPRNWHGNTGSLSESEIEDLLAYLLSL